MFAIGIHVLYFADREIKTKSHANCIENQTGHQETLSDTIFGFLIK